MSRPEIPAEIRRQVLVEAGHRCAIPQCGHGQVDVHHIIPWEKCREHSPENLIALCPNCHRRADSGEIDRKSLIIYKLRGKKIFRGQSAEEIGTVAAWSTRTFRDRRHDILKYEVEIEYPAFDPSQYSWAIEVDAYIRGLTLSQALGVRNIANEAPWTWDNTVEEEQSSFGGSFEVIFFGPPLLSLRFTFFSYHYGAAHPNHWTRTLNLYLDPVYKIELKHFFEWDADYLVQFSNAARVALSQRSHEGIQLHDKWIQEGTEPKVENFSEFNFSPVGFLITFDEYTVGPYASGRQEITLPYSTFSGLVLPEGIKRKET
jgi:hypothetical protein